MLLTTTGRKSGQQRVTPIFYLPAMEDTINSIPIEKGHFLLIASNWGASTDPIWWLNLQVNPRAQVRIGKKTMAVTARKADSEERSRLWPLITSRYTNFADYQRSTRREIPVVILTPIL
jgi:F420H(2)-dependent quinone reductase